MTLYLDLETALLIAEQAIGATPLVADWDLLESALARPQTSVSGQDAYSTLHRKAAALLHSLARNHCLVDGNKQLAWLATAVFCHINGHVVAVADGGLADVNRIAEQFAGGTS